MKMNDVIRLSLRNGNSFFYNLESELFDDKFFIGSEMEENNRYFYIYKYCEGSARIFKMPRTKSCTLNGAKCKLAVVWAERYVC